MAYDWMPDYDLSERELAALERSYRRDLQDVAAARASCASLRDVADHDEREILRTLARVEFLLARKAPRHVVERLEEDAFA